MTKPLFRSGRLIATASALRVLQEAGQDPYDLLQRHMTGDWGDVSDDVGKANDWSSRSFFTVNIPRICSLYGLPSGLSVWVITEADRTVTTFLLPEEYQLAGTQSVGPMVQLTAVPGATRDLKNQSGQ